MDSFLSGTYLPYAAKNATIAQFDFLYHTMFPVKKKGKKRKKFTILPRFIRNILPFCGVRRAEKSSPAPKGGGLPVKRGVQLSIRAVSRAPIWR